MKPPTELGMNLIYNHSLKQFGGSKGMGADAFTCILGSQKRLINPVQNPEYKVSVSVSVLYNVHKTKYICTMLCTFDF